MSFILITISTKNLEFLGKRNKVFVFQGLYGQHFYNGQRLGACHKITGRRDEKPPTLNTLSRSITRIMRGHKVRTTISAALTRCRKKVRKLRIKPKEAGAFHFPGARMWSYFTLHASLLLLTRYTGGMLGKRESITIKILLLNCELGYVKSATLSYIIT